MFNKILLKALFDTIIKNNIKYCTMKLPQGTTVAASNSIHKQKENNIQIT